MRVLKRKWIKHLDMRIRNYPMTTVVLFIFYAIAFTLWYATGSLFDLSNFVLMGTYCSWDRALASTSEEQERSCSTFKPSSCWRIYVSRTRFRSHLYVFGVIVPENNQIEEFFWLLGELFAASVIHYSIAKSVVRLGVSDRCST